MVRDGSSLPCHVALEKERQFKKYSQGARAVQSDQQCVFGNVAKRDGGQRGAPRRGAGVGIFAINKLRSRESGVGGVVAHPILSCSFAMDSQRHKLEQIVGASYIATLRRKYSFVEVPLPDCLDMGPCDHRTPHRGSRAAVPQSCFCTGFNAYR